jgi:hypothetical protein
MKTREFYEARAIALLKELWESQDNTYVSMQKKLQTDYGENMTAKALRNLFYREHKQFAQILLILDAMGVEFLEIPKHEKVHAKSARPGKALTAADLRRLPNHPLKR